MPKSMGTNMYESFLIIFLLIAFGLDVLIILQQNKAAEAGILFEARSARAPFSASGAGNLITRTTAVLAALFFFLSLILGNISSNQSKKISEWENLKEPEKSEQATPNKFIGDIPQ